MMTIFVVRIKEESRALVMTCEPKSFTLTELDAIPMTLNPVIRYLFHLLSRLACQLT